MIHLTQPGGAGEALDGEAVRIGARCYLEAEGEKASWAWSLEAPEGSVALLSAPKSPFPNFAPEIAGKYRIEFVGSDDVKYNLTIRAF
jgi:hypothetical protein